MKEEIIIENHENDSEYWLKVLEKDITRMELAFHCLFNVSGQIPVDCQ